MDTKTNRMETAIYQEVKAIAERVGQDLAYAYQQGDKESSGYFQGQLEILRQVVLVLEKHGLKDQVDSQPGVSIPLDAFETLNRI